jgi:hypothetical protein
MKIRSIINNKSLEGERRETRKRGPTDQKRSLPNPGTNSLVPQRNVRVRDRDINTPPPPAHSRWLTLRRFQREKIS